MEILIVLGIIIAAFAALDILSLTFGVDSRPGFPDPRQPSNILSIR